MPKIKLWPLVIYMEQVIFRIHYNLVSKAGRCAPRWIGLAAEWRTVPPGFTSNEKCKQEYASWRWLSAPFHINLSSPGESSTSWAQAGQVKDKPKAFNKDRRATQNRKLLRQSNKDASQWANNFLGNYSSKLIAVSLSHHVMFESVVVMNDPWKWL